MSEITNKTIEGVEKTMRVVQGVWLFLAVVGSILLGLGFESWFIGIGVFVACFASGVLLVALEAVISVKFLQFCKANDFKFPY